MARLLIQNEVATLVARELNWGLTTVGRGLDNDIVISHRSVSAAHCEFELSLEGLRVRDVRSTNGTFVNGKPIKEVWLEPGQALRLGEIHATVEWSKDQVVVPEVHTKAPRCSVALVDDVMSCHYHNGTPSVWHCPKCHQYFCVNCTRGVNLVGRPAHRLCPLCSGHVERAPWAPAVSRKPSLWKRVKGAFGRTRRIR